MTLDEVIQRENKIAEENQKIVDTEIVFDDVSISQLYCDDTEVIEVHLSNYRKYAEYHKKIAEWLEELKELREISKKNPFLVYMIKHEKIVRNKAIDDFAEKFIYKAVCEGCSGCCSCYEESRQNECEDYKSYMTIAEQLKAGITND